MHFHWQEFRSALTLLPVIEEHGDDLHERPGPMMQQLCTLESSAQPGWTDVHSDSRLDGS